ncbi:replication initiation protein, partial [Streptococcus pluranimalium]
YFAIEKNGKRGIRMGQLFSMIDFMEDGEITFRFSEFAAPYVFALRTQYYSFKLAEIARIKSKYGLVLMKLWESRRYRDQRVTTIEGDLDEWQDWFLGSEKRIPPAIFKRNCLTVGAEELEKKLGVEIFLNTIKNGRKVVGYEMQIIDNRPPTTADIYRQEMKEYQATLFD